MNTGSTVHVVFCGAAYGDYDELRRCEHLGRATEPWPVPKTACGNDRVIFYNVDREKAFVATGIVQEPPKSDGSNSHYHFRAPLARISMLKLPLSRAEARRAFSQWRWLKYTRNMTTAPADFRRSLWAHLRGREAPRTSETASRAKTLFGDKTYQIRAKVALPVLVALAQQGAKIYYEDLAQQLGISNPRVLNYVLGSIGQTLRELGRRWDEAIPPIQSLVINQQHQLPGEGVGFFIDEADYGRMSDAEKRRVVDRLHGTVWRFEKWDAVLSALQIAPTSIRTARALRKRARFQGGGYGDPKRNRIVEAAAVNSVKRYLRNHGYRVKSRERECIGYDLDATRNGSTLHIEVKGVSGQITEFLITKGEVNKAKDDLAFQLCIVTRALSKGPLLRFYSGKQLLADFRLEPTAFRATPK